MASAHFQQITSHQLESGVVLLDKDGKEYPVRKVVQHYLTSSRPVMEVLRDLTYFHEEMTDVARGSIYYKAGKEGVNCFIWHICYTRKNQKYHLQNLVKQPLLVNLHMGAEPSEFVLREAEQGGGRQVFQIYLTFLNTNIYWYTSFYRFLSDSPKR